MFENHLIRNVNVEFYLQKKEWLLANKKGVDKACSTKALSVNLQY